MIELPRAALTAGQIAEAARVLLLRYERPDPDGVGLLPRRRGGLASSPRTWRRASSGSRRSRRSTGTASARWSAAPSRPAGPPARTSSSASAASTAATRSRCTSSTRWASTTSPARRSGSRSRAWRRAARPPSRRAATAADLHADPRTPTGCRRLTRTLTDSTTAPDDPEAAAPCAGVPPLRHVIRTAGVARVVHCFVQCANSLREQQAVRPWIPTHRPHPAYPRRTRSRTVADRRRTRKAPHGLHGALSVGSGFVPDVVQLFG